eukprot:COSAG03_NODE_1053_length_4945_cov_10.648783_1_plen_42_part_00
MCILHIYWTEQVDGTQHYYKKDGSENRGNLPQCRKGAKKSQ